MKLLHPKLTITASHCAFLVYSLFAGQIISAGEYTSRWVGTQNGSWQNATNWDPPRVPNNNGADVYDVIWEKPPITITLDGPVTIRNFTFAARGTLTGDFDLVVEGKLLWTPGPFTAGGTFGTMTGHGRTTIKGDAELLASATSDFLVLRSRVLALHGTTKTTVQLQLEDGARVRNEPTGRMDLNEGTFDSLADGPQVENLGIIRFLTAADTYFVRSAFLNYGFVEIGNRTVNFQRGFTQEAGTIQVDGTTTELTISGGILKGQGRVRSAKVGEGGHPAILAGRLIIEQLWLFPETTLEVSLSGRSEGAFDQTVVTGQLFRPGNSPGSLNIRFASGFENSVHSTDAFKVLAIRTGVFVGGDTWAPLGQRIRTIGDQGSFLVTESPGEPGSIVLRDFKPLPLGIVLSEESIVYPLPNPPGFSIPVYPAAVVKNRADVAWDGVVLNARITQNFHLNEDSLEATYGPDLTSVSDGFLGARVSFRGVPFAQTIPLVGGDGRNWTFNAQATAEAVQALVRSLAFKNNQFGVDRFTQWNSSYPSRTIELEFSSAGSVTARFRKEISFPVLVGIDVLGTDGLDEYPGYAIAVGDFIVDVEGSFSDGFRGSVPMLSVTWSGCVPDKVNEIDNRSFSRTKSFLTACALIAQAGPFQSYLCISPYSVDCFGSTAQILDDCQNSLSQPANQIRAAAVPVRIPLSMANLRALELLMRQTSEGSRLRDLYYQHGPEVIRLSIANPNLMTKAISILREFQPAVNNLLSGKGASARITQTPIDELREFWFQLSEVASPGLKAVLETEQARFNGFQQFVGRDFSQWAGLLKIPAPVQPWIHASSPRLADGQFSVEVNDVSGLKFTLWKSSNLSSFIWQPVTNAQVQLDGFTVRLIDPTPPTSRVFYRIHVTPSLQ